MISTWRKTLHWTTAIGVIALLIIGKWMTELDESAIVDVNQSLWKFSLHKTIGVIVLALTLVRFVSMTLGSGFQSMRHSNLETMAATAVQTYFLICLIVLPVTGLLMHAFASGAAPIYLWPSALEPGLRPRPDLVDLSASIHGVLANGLIIAFLLHAGGALKHELIDHDGTLRRMWFTGDALANSSLQKDSPPPVRFGRVFGAVSVCALIIVGVILQNLENATTQARQTNLASHTSSVKGIVWVSMDEESALRVFATQGKNDFEAQFDRFEVTVTTDDDEQPIAIGVNIDSSSFKSGLKNRDDVVAGSDWLDAKSYPVSSYETTSIDIQSASNAAGAYTAEGQLKIRDVEATVPLLFTWSIDESVPDSDWRRLQGEATFDRHTLDLGRGDFKADSAAAKTVRITFDVRLQRA